MKLQEALSAAIAYEHRVRDHYAACAKRTKDPVGKRVFTALAREEQGHVDYLESRMDEWKASGRVELAELGSLLPPPSWLEEEVRGLAEVARGRSAHSQELDFLKEALELEATTSAFYHDLIEAVEPTYRPLFERFLEIEEGHLSIVQAEIDALVGHGHWFDFMEFRLEQ